MYCGYLVGRALVVHLSRNTDVPVQPYSIGLVL